MWGHDLDQFGYIRRKISIILLLSRSGVNLSRDRKITSCTRHVDFNAKKPHHFSSYSCFSVKANKCTDVIFVEGSGDRQVYLDANFLIE